MDDLTPDEVARMKHIATEGARQMETSRTKRRRAIAVGTSLAVAGVIVASAIAIPLLINRDPVAGNPTPPPSPSGSSEPSSPPPSSPAPSPSSPEPSTPALDDLDCSTILDPDEIESIAADQGTEATVILFEPTRQSLSGVFAPDGDGVISALPEDAAFCNAGSENSDATSVTFAASELAGSERDDLLTALRESGLYEEEAVMEGTLFTRDVPDVLPKTSRAIIFTDELFLVVNSSLEIEGSRLIVGNALGEVEGID